MQLLYCKHIDITSLLLIHITIFFIFLIPHDVIEIRIFCTSHFNQSIALSLQVTMYKTYINVFKFIITFSHLSVNEPPTKLYWYHQDYIIGIRKKKTVTTAILGMFSTITMCLLVFPNLFHLFQCVFLYGVVIYSHTCQLTKPG